MFPIMENLQLNREIPIWPHNKMLTSCHWSVVVPAQHSGTKRTEPAGNRADVHSCNNTHFSNNSVHLSACVFFFFLLLRKAPHLSAQEGSFAYKVEDGLHFTTTLYVWGILLLAVNYKYCSHLLSAMHRGVIRAHRDLQERECQEVTTAQPQNTRLISDNTCVVDGSACWSPAARGQRWRKTFLLHTESVLVCLSY